MAAKTPRVYFSFNSVQGVVDPFTPLGGDLLQLLASGFLQVAKVRQPIKQALPQAGGRIFIDVTEITKIWRLALSRLDPGAQCLLDRGDRHVAPHRSAPRSGGGGGVGE